MTSPFDLRKQTFQEHRDTGFDADAVHAVTEAMGFTRNMRNELYAVAESYRRRRPLMADLREYRPDMPVYLDAFRPSNLRDRTAIIKLFPLSRGWRLPFVTRLFELREEQAAEIDGRAIALVIPWPGIGSALVLHQVPLDVDLDGSRVLFTNEVDGVRHRLTLEPVDQFVDLLWTFD